MTSHISTKIENIIMELTSSQSQAQMIDQLLATVCETAKQNLNKEINLSIWLDNNSIHQNPIKMVVNMSIRDTNQPMIKSKEILNPVPSKISARVSVYENNEYKITKNIEFSLGFFNLEHSDRLEFKERPFAFHLIRDYSDSGTDFNSLWNTLDAQHARYTILLNRFLKLHVEPSFDSKYYNIQKISLLNGSRRLIYTTTNFLEFLIAINDCKEQNEICIFDIYCNEIHL